MNFRELVTRISRNTGYYNNDVNTIVRAMFDEIADELATGGSVYTPLGKVMFIMKEVSSIKLPDNQEVSSSTGIPMFALRLKASKALKKKIITLWEHYGRPALPTSMKDERFSQVEKNSPFYKKDK